MTREQSCFLSNGQCPKRNRRQHRCADTSGREAYVETPRIGNIDVVSAGKTRADREADRDPPPLHRADAFVR